jgi:membrane-bound lytic murein transglycosylase B
MRAPAFWVIRHDILVAALYEAGADDQKVIDILSMLSEFGKSMEVEREG